MADWKRTDGNRKPLKTAIEFAVRKTENISNPAEPSTPSSIQKWIMPENKTKWLKKVL